MIRKMSTFRRVGLICLVRWLPLAQFYRQLNSGPIYLITTKVAIHQFVFHGIMGQFRIRFHFELFKDAGAVGADGFDAERELRKSV
jgi:hypothetical protein